MPIPPDGITREHVLKAIDEINREGVPPKHQAQNTFLVVEGKKYPVKYVVLKAAKVAGVDISINEFTTIEAKNYLKRLGFNIGREEWELGIRILSKAGEGFIKRASEEGFNVSRNQLGYFSKKGHTIYYQLKLPPELNVSSKLVHFEWLARPEEEGAQFMVGLHLEFPREQRELNKKLADLLVEYVDLDELGKRVGAPVVREDKVVFTWFTANKTYESPADTEEEIVEWLVTSMLEFYKTFLPALREVLPMVLREDEVLEKKLKGIVLALKEKYQDDWNSIKEEINEKIEKVRKTILSNKEITKEDYREIDKTISEINRAFGKTVLWVWGSVNAGEEGALKFLNRQDFRELLAIGNAINEFEQVTSLRPRLESIMKKPHTKLSTISSWLCIVNPSIFIPANRQVFGYPVRQEIGVDIFFGSRSNVSTYLVILGALWKIKNEIGISDMLELAFYLSRADSEISSVQHWVEISGPPEEGYVGKILITPNKYQIKPGDVVYHYITDSGPEPYKKTFIGKSRVKEGFRKVPKEEALARLKEYVNWDEKFKKFAQERWGKARELYVTELEDFQEFKPPVPLEKVGGVFTPTPKYLVRGSSGLVRILEGLDSGDNMMKKIEEKIDSILSRKGQLILYGPPGTGKTWLASKYIRHKVPNGIHRLGKDSSLREDIKYYLLVMSTAKYDPSQIKEGLEEVFSGKLRHAFEDVEEGDIAFVYLTHPYKRITAIARCTGKTEEGAKFKIIKLVNGPTYEEMKREEPISDSPAVRTMLRGTLFPLSHEEAQWIASKIGFDTLKPLGVLDEGTKREFRAFEFVTFHPAFSYEDFVEGIKPETYEDPETGKKELLFKVEEGVFKRISRNAYNALLAWAGVEKEWTENTGLPSLSKDEIERIKRKIKNEAEGMPKFYLIIDEINRGDIPKIFGELITLLETDKRLFMDNETVTTLPYSKKRFGVPPNLHIIGTMNTSDRSIALMDVALRRRFGFIEMMPDYTVLNEHIIDNASEEVKPLAGIAVSALKALNKRIKREYDRDHQIGHSYYFRLNDHLNSREEFLKELKMIWFHEILPLLQEYFYDSPEKLERVLKSKNSENSFIRSSEDGIELKSEDEFTDDSFLEALKALIEAERE
ncbi:McrB family protein [Thermococcus pacificus]|uniref:AAA+ ATPase domain-containing protein n=1 Tax=Thermococcus pacificus TaxID=71998 RepID=A0A218P9D7_9EURY|nr:AAA family ATPase [Thermococcus pacificus]ASJ07383.1 hypothetical protein A3L08_08660 [Thermococcus pacificus]